MDTDFTDFQDSRKEKGREFDTDFMGFQDSERRKMSIYLLLHRIRVVRVLFSHLVLSSSFSSAPLRVSSCAFVDHLFSGSSFNRLLPDAEDDELGGFEAATPTEADETPVVDVVLGHGGVVAAHEKKASGVETEQRRRPTRYQRMPGSCR
ncbi:MAG: hypothetical protein R2873_20800 [Caldilineaceae bacterium]